MEEEKVRIKLNIAGEQLTLFVPYSRQEQARQIESEINNVFATWRKRFPEKDDRELLVMIAFRYAELYSTLRGERLEAEEKLSKMQQSLDSILKTK